MEGQQSGAIRSRLQIRIPYLPDELIEEILSRLPVKPILKLRCVSKSWRSLISSKNFIEAHLQDSRKDPNFTRHWIIQTCRFKRSMNFYSLPSLFSGHLTRPIEVEFPTDFEAQIGRVHVVGTCNGLVCLVSGENLFLWNPSTKKFKKLPPVDDMVTFCGFGFGFDQSYEDYKVMVSFSGLVKIYCLRTDSWKRIDIYDIPPSGDMTFVSGKLYWFKANKSYSETYIVSFDLRTEMCGNVALPTGYVKSGFLPYVGVVGGYLCVCDPLSRTSSFDVWVMKEHETWAKLVTVPCSRRAFSRPLCIGPNDEVLLILESKVMIYSPRNNRFRCHAISDFDHHSGADVYFESLVSLV